MPAIQYGDKLKKKKKKKQTITFYIQEFDIVRNFNIKSFVTRQNFYIWFKLIKKYIK